MTEIVDVGAVQDFAEEEAQIVTVAGREIAVIRWRGRLFALRNICPHQGAPLCGDLAPRLESAGPGDVRSLRGAGIVQCTRHRWEFDVTSGKALYDPKLRVKTYEIREDDGRVTIEI